MKQTLPFSIFLLSCIVFFTSAYATEAIWLLVDTTKLSLEVKQGNETLAVMNNISIGRNGAGFKTRRGDDITPLGSYKIGWVNNNSRYYKFYGFDYPSVENASEALLSGLLSQKTYNTVIDAHINNKIPSQNTKIGGQIGIHGLGGANKNVHKLMNWTHGCIAITDRQIDQLQKWIGKGTMVIVK